MYLLLRDLHYWISRVGLAAALVMFAAAVYIGLVRHGDATKTFRRATYAVFGLTAFEALIGLLMYLSGGYPGQDVHFIYGMGATLSLPFFIYVERTARKRPAMGSYLWGFALLAGVVVRAIMTGPHMG